MSVDRYPPCPVCTAENTYPDGAHLVCADCGHEWSATARAPAAATSGEDAVVVRDVNGTPLADGDAVILVKDLKVKGSTSTPKKGTKIKSIRLPEAADGHDVECRLDIGTIMLKSEFLKKA